MSNRTAETNLKDFPPSKYREFCRLMNIDNVWENLASEILKRDGSGPRFSSDDIQFFKMSLDPASVMLNSWKTDCVTFKDLIHWLTIAGLDRQTLFVKELINQTNQTNASKSLQYSDLHSWTNAFDNRKVEDGGCLIGQGGYADVFRGKDSNTGQIVAIKRFKSSYSDVRIQFENEISVLTRCKHSNLVSMIGYSNDGSQFCLVYEFMSNGSLQDHLSSQKDSNNSLDMHRRLSILKDVAKGIDYLHKNNFIHRDIKSANILLNEQFEAKLGDYGITKLLSENCTHAFTSMIVGTTVYMAPEYILDGKVSAKTDVYSYGVVLLELLTGLPAYDQRRDEHSLVEHMKAICDEQTLLQYADKMVNNWEVVIIKGIYTLSLGLLDKELTRLSIKEVIETIDTWTV